jgi:hypothetical protein
MRAPSPASGGGHPSLAAAAGSGGWRGAGAPRPLVWAVVALMATNALLLLHWTARHGAFDAVLSSSSSSPVSTLLDDARGGAPCGSGRAASGDGEEADALARLGFPRTGAAALAFLRDVVVPPWFPPQPSASSSSIRSAKRRSSLRRRRRRRRRAALQEETLDDEEEDGAPAAAAAAAATPQSSSSSSSTLYPSDPPNPAAWRLSAGPTAEDAEFRRRHASLARYLDGAGSPRPRGGGASAFRRRLDSLRAIPDDDPDLGAGIVMVAGGKYYLPQAVVALRVLRKHARSSLPVELFWNGQGEGVDEEALAWLSREFGPLVGRDARAAAREEGERRRREQMAEADGDDADKASTNANTTATATAPPDHYYAPEGALKGFALKPFALLHSRFKRALLLDCDAIVLRDPRSLFFDRGFAARGAWLWPDIYGAGMVSEEAYSLSGLNASASAALDSAKGEFSRHAESGQVLIDRSRHLDALEWAWLLNAFGDRTGLYKKVYGDKDTFGIGFALAGKPWAAQHVPVPPAGVFSHRQTLGMGESAQLNKQGNWWLVSVWGGWWMGFFFREEGGGGRRRGGHRERGGACSGRQSLRARAALALCAAALSVCRSLSLRLRPLVDAAPLPPPLSLSLSQLSTITHTHTHTHNTLTHTHTLSTPPPPPQKKTRTPSCTTSLPAAPTAARKAALCCCTA